MGNYYVDKLKVMLDKEPIEQIIQDKYLDAFIEMSISIEAVFKLKIESYLKSCSISSKTNTIESSILEQVVYDDIIVPEFIKFSTKLVNNGLAISYKVVELVNDECGGIELFDANNTILFKLEVIMGNMSVYGHFKYRFSGSCSYKSDIERIISKKCLSLLYNLNSVTPKDLYSIAHLFNSFIEVDIKRVVSYIHTGLTSTKLNDLMYKLPISIEDMCYINNLWCNSSLGNISTNKEFIIICNSLYRLFGYLSYNYNPTVDTTKDKEYYLESVLPRIVRGGCTKLVLCGTSAMYYNGLCDDKVHCPDVLVETNELDGLRLYDYVNYYYVEDIDYINYLTPLDWCTNILVPSIERAIIECIKYDLRFTDEMYFCDVFGRFINGYSYDLSKLEEVANHFDVPMSKVNYWIEESNILSQFSRRVESE